MGTLGFLLGLILLFILLQNLYPSIFILFLIYPSFIDLPIYGVEKITTRYWWEGVECWCEKLL
jgi:hypothetical protein